MWFAFLLSLVVVAYNNLINRWSPFHGTAYVPVNLAFAGATAMGAVIAFDLSTDGLVLRADPGDVLLPLLVVAVVAVALFAVARSRHAHRIADRRVANMDRKELAWYVLFRIPFGTAVTEELIFRGVLFAVWRETGMSTLAAAVLSSAAFGLWHISPTVIGLRMNDPGVSTTKVRAAVVGAVVLTTIAGLGFSWLRLENGGLLGPVIVHAGVNSVGALAAWGAHRRARSSP